MSTIVIWECVNCNITIDPGRISDHLKKVHSLEGDEIIVVEELIASARSKDYFMQQWSYKAGNVKLIYKCESES